MGEIRYPSPQSMFVRSSVGGAELEGRATRSGGGSMKIAAYCKSWEVDNFRWTTIQIPEMSLPVKMVSYDIKITTFLPWDKFVNNYKRLDTVNFWLLSYQEVLRHLALASQYTASPRWKTMRDIAIAEFDNIKDVFLKYIDLCLHADISLDQYIYYVKEHASSASPFGGKYGDLLEKPGLLKLAHERTLDWMRSYRDFYNSKPKPNEDLLVNASLCYPGVRARPADYVVRQISDYDILVHAEKWRDRKVGGIPGLSQMTFSIFDNEYHAKADNIFLDYVKKLLGIEVLDLGVHGPMVYKDLMDTDKSKLFIYDGKTQEKQTGLLLKEHGWAVDLGHPRFEAQFAPEMYSGIGITKPLNLLTLGIYTRAEMDDNDFKPTKMWSFSDNIAYNEQPPPSVHIDTADEFCGFNPTLKRFGPPSVTTDNPTHRVQFKNNHQKQVQRMQYIMRPFLACATNDMIPGTCERFINYVVDKKIIPIGTTDQMLQDDMKDVILSQDRAVHEGFRSAFSDVDEYVKRWFITQDRDPDFSTDLRVLD